MFLRANRRFKDGKTHRDWSVVENRRVSGGRTVQKTLLYLGEINDSDRASWTRAIQAVDEREETRQIHLFPEDRTPDPLLKHPTLKLRLDQIELARPRQWGGCWLALELWNRLDLDAFWQPLLPDSQKGTSDKTTLAGMLEKITTRYGKERRTWIMDRGIPSEETLAQMRQTDPSVRYLVGTPKGRLTKLEKDPATKDWQQVKDDVHVKLLNRNGELYVLARSLPRRCKESAMRRKKLKAYWAHLKELQKREKLTCDELLLAI